VAPEPGNVGEARLSATGPRRRPGWPTRRPT